MKINTYLSKPKNDPQKRFILGEPKGVNNILWVCFNPSTAFEEELDNTTKNAKTITENNFYSGWYLVNLCAARSTKPEDLPFTITPELFQDNFKAIKSIFENKDKPISAVCLAWGNLIKEVPRDYMRIAYLSLTIYLEKYQLPVFCIDTTAKKHPLHPSQRALNAKKLVLNEIRLQPFDHKSYTEEQWVP